MYNPADLPNTRSMRADMKSAGMLTLVLLLLAGCSPVREGSRGSQRVGPTSLAFSNPRQNELLPVPVVVSFIRDRATLRAHFEIKATTVNARPQLSRNEYPYDYDVVEVFVSNARSGSSTYYEFEVSPYNQALQVNGMSPRLEYYFGVRDGFAHTATLTAGGWAVDMFIPLTSIGWHDGQPLELIGNAYAALGAGDARAYWSLFELPPGQPDFHIPGAFRPLLGAN